jgi:alkylated DNA repair dioxygenase AlkB
MYGVYVPVMRTQFRKLDVHLESMYEPEIANEIFELLKTVEMNSDEDSQVMMFGKWINIPRKQTAFGDPGTNYSFSGNTVPATPWTPWLEAIRQNVAMWLVETIPEIFDGPNAPSSLPNFVLVNRYNDGQCYIGPHSDDEKDLKGFTNSLPKIYCNYFFTRRCYT